MLTGWTERHSGYAHSDEDADYFIKRAYAKMWSAISPEKFHRFLNLKSLLRYLQLCLHGVMIDHVRTKETASLEELNLLLEGVEEPIIDALQQQTLWQQIERHLHNNREQQLLYYRYVLEFKPHQVCEQLPGEFPAINEVYKITQNIKTVPN